MPSPSHARSGERMLQLDIPVVLPGVDDAHDGCVARLQNRIQSQTGVTQAHIVNEDGHTSLCLHYNPNLVPLEKLERLVRDEGASITRRYRHETLPLKGMAQGTNVSNIESVVRRVPGVLDVTVNYAAELLYVEYDSTLTNRDSVLGAVRSLGYRIPVASRPLTVPAPAVPAPPVPVPAPLPKPVEPEPHDHAEHDHAEHDHAEHDHDHAGHNHDEAEHGEHDHEEHEGHDHATHEEHEEDKEHDHAEHDHAEKHGHAHEAPHEDHEHAEHIHEDHDHEEHEEHDHAGHGHEGHGHSHGSTDPNANWVARNPELAMSLFAGVLTAGAYGVQRFFHLPLPVALAFYALAYLAGGYDLARHTVPTVLRGKFDVEFLMLVAAGGAAILGDYFEGALLLFLFSFGHSLEHFAMERARNAIQALGSITPKVARVRRDGQELELPVASLRLGDVAIVRPGDRIAVDGVITSGHSGVDQSPITGESVPVEKAPGATVFAGSINGDGALEIEVSRLAKDTTMARVIKMVEEAQTQKSPTQTFTDKFERILVPAVLVTVVVAAVAPPALKLLPWNVAVLRALSMLVAASPCALALATPAAVLAAIGQAARNGVLIKGGVHLENLGALQAIALDKTGTLTRGKPEVSDVITLSGSERDLLTLAAAVETRSSHPLAQAVVRRAQADTLSLPSAGELQTLQGRGVQAQVNGHLVRIGNLRMFEEAHIPIPDKARTELQRLGDMGKPTMLVGMGNTLMGVLALADTMRPETPAALRQLKAAGIKTIVMLTGDNARVAQNIAQSAGVTEVRADLLPENKVTVLQELLKTYGQVAMVGDGVNDAPALANATVGIAMGAGGTDVALETADVALMADDLTKLPFAVGLSRQSRTIIRQNLWISLGVIALLVPATLLGWAGISAAVIFHEGSTLLVVANALRLLGYKPK